jgi:hypothetical protein
MDTSTPLLPPPYLPQPSGYMAVAAHSAQVDADAPKRTWIARLLCCFMKPKPVVVPCITGPAVVSFEDTEDGRRMEQQYLVHVYRQKQAVLEHVERIRIADVERVEHDKAEAVRREERHQMATVHEPAALAEAKYIFQYTNCDGGVGSARHKWITTQFGHWDNADCTTPSFLPTKYGGLAMVLVYYNQSIPLPLTRDVLSAVATNVDKSIKCFHLIEGSAISRRMLDELRNLSVVLRNNLKHDYLFF